MARHVGGTSCKVSSVRSLDNPKLEGWGVKKDKGEFDQFTGATITPRAVTRAVKQTLLYYQANRQQLLKQATPDATPDGSGPATGKTEESDNG